MTISLVRTIILYLTLTISLRIMGKRQIGDLQTSELVVTLLASNLASVPMQDTALPITSGLIPIFTLVAMEVIISVLMLKVPSLRTVITGKPVIVIADGILNQHSMRKLRFSIEDLMSNLRQAGIFDISEVLYGIVETNGKITVLKKAKDEPPTAESLKIDIPEKGMSATVINDGIISDLSLGISNRNKEWLNNILTFENKKAEDIFIMTVNKAGEYIIIEKEDKK